MTSLYDLTKEFEQLDQLLLETETDHEKIAEVQQMVSLLITSKIDSCAEYDRSLTDYITAIESKIDDLKGLLKSVTRKQDRYLDYVKSAIENTGTSEIKGNFYKAAIKITKSVEVNEEEFNKIKNDIEFEARGFVRRKITLEPNKDKIKEALQTEKLNFAQIKENKKVNFKMGKL